MKDIFKESELTIYPLGIHAGKITVFLYHRERLEKFFSGESVLALLHEIGYIDTDLKQVLPDFFMRSVIYFPVTRIQIVFPLIADESFYILRRISKQKSHLMRKNFLFFQILLIMCAKHRQHLF